MDDTKICNKCLLSKSRDDFYNSSGSICKKCKNLASETWNNANRERRSVKNKIWYAANKEKSLTRQRVWSQDNKTLKSAYTKMWKKANPEKVRANNRKRYAIKQGATTTLTIVEEREVWKEFHGLCFWCGQIAEHLDHIVPLIPRKGEIRGHHTKGNVVPSCQPCNNQKSNKDPLVFLFQKRALHN